MALVALEIQRGDEVIVPSLTFAASANVIKYVGAKPVFCDIISHSNLTIDPKEIIRKRIPIALNLNQVENLLHLRIQEDFQHLRVQEDLQSQLIGSLKMTLEQKICEKKLHQENLG